MNRILKISLIFLLGCGIFISCKNPTETPTAITERVFLPTQDNVKYLGRSTLINDQLVMNYSSCGAEFYVKAKNLKVTLTGRDYVSAEDGDKAARVVVYVDDERILDELILEQEKEYTIFENTEVQEARVRIIKITDPSLPMAAIKQITTDKDGSICATQAKNLKIEFIGDSITCAFGVDGKITDEDSNAKVEDSTKSYAYLTAQALNADYSLVAIPGWGVITGATSDGNKNANCIPTYYSKLSYSYWQTFGEKKPQNIDWDFSQFVPDVVVINLGTNDSTYTSGDAAKIAEFVTGYKAFLKEIRAKNANAEILCILGTLGQYLCDGVEQAATEYSAETKDVKISVLKLPEMSYSDGVGSLNHPSLITQKKTAVLLTEKINSILLGK